VLFFEEGGGGTNVDEEAVVIEVEQIISDSVEMSELAFDGQTEWVRGSAGDWLNREREREEYLLWEGR
jgi:hypothetical protein